MNDKNKREENPGGEENLQENEDPQIQNPNHPSTTDQMEVHHHPQTNHQPKPWKEYLLEGLMIFIAVTLGFFAENLREKISDSHRENEFAKALYSELKDDSAIAANRLFIRLKKEDDMNYLRSYFRDSSLVTLPKKFYPAFTTSLYVINSYAFEPKDGILSQLRNSGSLRYFKSISLQKLLGDLSVCINNIRYRNEQEYQYFATPIKPFLLKYYDFGWLDSLRSGDVKSYLIDLIENYREGAVEIKGKILNIPALDRTEVCNMILFYKQMLVSTRSLQLKNYILTNQKILKVLRENYSLENEGGKE